MMQRFLNRVLFDPQNFGSVIAACMAGNGSAQRELFKRYFGFSKRICLRYASCSQEAEEILNEAFLKVFNNLDKYDPSKPFEPWLRTILVNAAISHYRKERRYQDLQTTWDNLPEYGIHDDDDIVGQISADEILEVIQQLKPNYRTVFLLHAVDGYNLKEISELLKINAATVRSYYFRARMQLQQLMAQEHPELSKTFQ